MGKRKTREDRINEIFVAAKTVFIKKGFQRTSMEDIIALTELSKGGFYHYYRSTKEILIDMMRRGNTQYMTLSSYFNEDFPTLDVSEQIELMMDAFIEKSTVVTDDRKVYTMFIHESMYDETMWHEYIKLENEFYSFICKALKLDANQALEDFMFLSRMLNAILFSQNMSRDPEVLYNKQEEIRQMFKPLLEDIVIKYQC